VKLLTLGEALTVKVAVLLLETELLQPPPAVIAVIVTVVEPVLLSEPEGMLKVPVLAPIVSVAVLPDAVLAPLKL
jgi:hypothetical protein